MEEHGLVIFPNGEIQKYGKYYCPDEKEYVTAPTHEESFCQEIVPSFLFKLSGYTYDKTVWIYDNALRLSLEGLLFVFNNQQKKLGPTEILAYLPIHPTEEQLQTLSANQELDQIDIKGLTEFHSFDGNDYTEYDNFQEYIAKKQLDMLNFS